MATYSNLQDHMLTNEDFWADWVYRWKCITSAELETKILAVSPAMDNYEQLDKDGQKILITIFQ